MSNTHLYFLLLLPYALIALSHRSSKYKMIGKVAAYTLGGVIVLTLYFNNALDYISLVFSLSALYVAFFTSLYSIEYVEKKHYPLFTDLVVDLFALSMISAFSIPNILGLAIAWTAAELFGFILVSIGERYSIEGSIRSSGTFLLTSTLMFELSVFTLIYVSIFTAVAQVTATFGEASFAKLIEPFWSIAPEAISAYPYLLPLLVLGFITKSAQIPLHFWLPEAHTVAPSPASALLSGVMTAMGIYGLLRISSFINLSDPTLLYLLSALGLISCIYGGVQAILQRDGKKLLAYSTIAGNGFATALLSYYIYTRDHTVLLTLLIAVLAHMSYKTTLFLDIGLIEQTIGHRYIRYLKGLVSILPISAVGALLSLLSLVGLPPTVGFTSKLFAIVITIPKLSEPLTSFVFLTTVVYIILSILIGLTYVRVYFGRLEMTRSASVSSVISSYTHASVSQQYLVLLNSLSNVMFVMPLVVYAEFRSYLMIYAMASPILLIFTYVYSKIMSRE